MEPIHLAELPDFNDNPYAYYARWRKEGPVHWLRDPGGFDFWLIVGYEEGRAALADPRLAKSPDVAPDPVFEVHPIGPNLLETDPPDHTRLRRMVSREFTARRVEQLAPRVAEITAGLLDALPSTGRGDLIELLAFPLPITVICELLGIPADDRETFRAWSQEVVAPTSVDASNLALDGLCAYLDVLIEAKRGAGTTGDLLSALIAAHDEDGDRLSVPELRGLAYLLLVAGHETTVHLIGNAVRALLREPGLLAAVRADFSLLDAVIEESLRHEAPVDTATGRYTTAPVEVGDTVIPAGAFVLVGIGAAGRDPERYPDPDTFDIGREGRGHVSFGHGIHFCVGAQLARLEVRIALEALLTRCPELALDPDAGPLEFLPGLLLRGVRALPVRW
ncbi:cytochrome P450 family protein [Streptomyces yaizuensis]|uniref:Cytochrome P450 n=1 Tax=Streptomyces yaizuensis TaxID=2989713 RepID=A0ABQ5P5Y1_9ACTN|nr:cytochrome P450 [Streptomyces sp. YSPA8]GLF97979.1 cytochrome P450 [Streptomyces sp. YSPA8]